MKQISANITGSLIINGTDVTDTLGSSSFWSGSLSTRVSNLESFSGSINSYTASNNTNISNLNATTSSLNLYTGSNNTNISNLNATSASLNLASGSAITRLNAIEVVTGSNISRLNSIESTTGSLNTASGSAITRLNALEVTSGSNITRISALESASGSAITRLNLIESTTGSLNAASGSAITRLNALEVTSGSNITRISALEVTSGSNISRLSSLESRTGSYATTGSNTFVGGQYLSSSFNPTGFTTTASLYTDGGLRVTRDAYISGTLYLNNVTVYGTQSVCFITSSQLNIASNIISVNTATPAVRFGGLSVYDSGSTGLTGSILWDSQDNQWIYSNPSGSAYDSAMFLVGPRNTGALGSEVGIECNFLSKGNGMHHMTSSGIFDDGSRTCFYGASIVTSTGVGCFSGAVCASSIASAGTINGTTIYGSTAICGGVVCGTNATFNGVLNVNPGAVLSRINLGYNFCIENDQSPEITSFINSSGTSIFRWMQGASPVERMRLSNLGYLGIGTCTPSRKLTISGCGAQGATTGAAIRLDNTTSGRPGIIDFDDSENLNFVASTDTGNIRFLTNTGTSTEKARITAAGIACFACAVCAPQVIASTSLTATIAYIQPNVLSGLSGLYLQNNNTGGYGVSLGLGLYGYNTNAYFNTLRIESSYPGFGRTLFFTKAQSNSAEVLALNWDGTGVACFSSTICTPQICASTYIGAACYLEGVLKTGVRGCYVRSIEAIPYIYYSERFPNDASGAFPFNQYGELIFQGGTRAGYNAGFSFVTGTADVGCTVTPTIKARIFESGIACFSCQICVGSLITNNTLDINGNSAIASVNDKFALGVNSTSYAWIQSYGGRPIYVNALGNNVLLPNNTTRLGIGTCTPSAKLHIDMGSISSDTNTIHLSSTDSSGTNKWGIVWYSGTGADFRGKVMADNNGKLYLDSVGGGGIILNCNGGSGNVGIGMTSPQTSLHIIKALGNDVISIGESGTNIRLTIGQEAAYTGNYINSRNIDLKLQSYLAGGSGGNIIFQTANDCTANVVTRMCIACMGNVYIACPVTIGTGCAAFGRALTAYTDIVAYFSSQESITMGISAGTGAQSWGIQVCDTGDGSNTLHLNARGGFVGINKGAGNTAGYPLDVTGTIKTDVLLVGSACNPSAGVNYLGSDGYRQKWLITQGRYRFCFATLDFYGSMFIEAYGTNYNQGTSEVRVVKAAIPLRYAQSRSIFNIYSLGSVCVGAYLTNGIGLVWCNINDSVGDLIFTNAGSQGPDAVLAAELQLLSTGYSLAGRFYRMCYTGTLYDNTNPYV